ncbi:MAG TPA: winged helix-turn-helix transcriptional regulator [Candidatus Thermoplasmatota archaeon]|nr:winged helix-turn-helix transcriptional regulator [Candidatus Thermoplasmatota archaeon]
MRAAALLLLLALAAPAAATPLEDAGEALERASRLRLPPRDASVGEAVRDAVAPPPDPVAPQAAGPLPPPEAVARAGADVLLWALAAGGFAASVGLGWRHLHARNVLDHPQRAAILALIRAQPGLHLRALARATSQPVQQAAYHLRVLERLGYARAQSIGGKKCYFEPGAAPEVRRALLEASLQPGEAAQRVLDVVQRNPGASQSEVARELGILPGAARWHLHRLATQGKLDEAREGRALTYRPRVSSGPRP